MFIFGDFVLC